MIYNVDQGLLVKALKAELKRQNVVVPPDWAAYVKTGHHREEPPRDDDWWYTRAASVLRTVYLRGPIGTEKLRVRYGGRKNRGVAPDKFFPAGGNHLRKILQQLESAQLIKQEEKGVHKGRVITPLGRKLIHAVANLVTAKELERKKSVEKEIKVEAKTEEKAETKPEPKVEAKAETKPEEGAVKEEHPKKGDA